MNLLEFEKELISKCVLKGGSMQGDEVGDRIEWLTKNQLQKIATDSSGWETLYLDPSDGRLWELTYPHGEMQGGGPQALFNISLDDAKKKYPV